MNNWLGSAAMALLMLIFLPCVGMGGPAVLPLAISLPPPSPSSATLQPITAQTITRADSRRCDCDKVTKPGNLAEKVASYILDQSNELACPVQLVAMQLIDSNEVAEGDRQWVGRIVNNVSQHPKLYAYICKNDKNQDVLRYSRKPLERPDGLHPDRPPVVPDLPIITDPYPPLQAKSIAYLQMTVSNHNMMVANSIPPKPVARAGQSTPGTKSKAQSEYAVIAEELSQNYSLGGHHVINEPLENFMASVAKNAIDPVIQRAASHIADLTLDTKRLIAKAKQSREDRIQVAESTLARARRGEYSHDETHEYHTPAGWVTKTNRIDDNYVAAFWANIMLSSAKKDTDEVIHARLNGTKAIRMNYARADAWDELLPKMADSFAGPDSPKPLVEVTYHDEPLPKAIDQLAYQQRQKGFSQFFTGKYKAKNVSNKTLNHITFAVDFYHYATLPEVTMRHVYYVPLWKAGEELELSKIFLIQPDIAWKFAVPFDYRANNANTPPPPDLIEMAGVVRMKITLWANEAKQRPTTIDFQQRIDKVIKAVVDLAEDLVSSSIPFYESSVIVRSLRAIQPLLPDQSVEAQKVKLMLTDPKKSRQLIQKRDRNLLVQSCAVGKRYTNEETAHSDWDSLGAIFTACDTTGKQIRAEIFSARKPDQTRTFVGNIDISDKGIPTVTLKPVGLAINWPPYAGPDTENHPFLENTIACTFELSDEGLRCISWKQGYGTSQRWYELAAAPANDQQLKAAQERSRKVSSRDLKKAFEQERPGNPGSMQRRRGQ